MAATVEEASIDAAVWTHSGALEPLISRELFKYIVALRRELHEYPELAFEEVKTSARIREELGKIEGVRVLDSAAGGTGVLALISGGSPGKTVLFRADMDALPIQEVDPGSAEGCAPPEKRKKLVLGFGGCASCGHPGCDRPGDPEQRAALPSRPARRKNCISAVRGVSHACGHDGHCAMLVGAARQLAAVRHQLCGAVVLLFQPAEERHPKSNPNGGALRVIRDIGAGEELHRLLRGVNGGVRDAPALRPENERFFTDGQDQSMDGKLMDCVDEVYGAHLWNYSRAGTLGCAPGSITANSDSLQLLVHGKGGHASSPQGTVDAVLVAAQLVTSLQAVVSRNISPTESAVISLGRIEGGCAPNVIAESVEILGTVRTYTAAVKRTVRRRIEEVARGVAASHGPDCSIEVKYSDGYPACVNDAACADAVLAAGRKLVGQLVGPSTPNMVGEDFAFLLSRKPGAFFFVGSNPDAPFQMDPGLEPEPEEVEHGTRQVRMHHTPEFDVHEGALWCGAAMWVSLALQRLQ